MESTAPSRSRLPQGDPASAWLWPARRILRSRRLRRLKLPGKFVPQRSTRSECYRVRDLSLAKEDLKLYFNEGSLIFSKPVHGERVSAVFTADVEGGDGEALLLPPYRGERVSLARFTHSPNLDEHLVAALLVFSDGSAQTLLDAIAQGGGRKAPELGPLLADQWNPVLSNIEAGFQLRLVQDLLTPPALRHGLLFGALAGKTLGSFDAFYDSGSENQIAVSAARQKPKAASAITSGPAFRRAAFATGLESR